MDRPWKMIDPAPLSAYNHNVGFDSDRNDSNVIPEEVQG